ncbi:LOW QUALITY PROTEIN: neural-cadherin, partial [Penaeus vannamei]|uniref:LOW QUALITY PROTEIN: neural-cadherin n=1 Tax=Penaeus vannamei TaxID=6689 RepID=UPI00387F51AC
PAGDTLLEVTADDRDTSNYFFYRVVEASGWGWDHFAIRTVATCGELYAVKTLDYEDASHRRGFKFMVQVTDRGRGGWDDARHTDTAWVSIRLKDVNDNPPEFRRSLVHITVREDTAPGTLLASMPAWDPDMEGRQRVEYRVVGGWGALSVEAGGGVRLWRALDREGEGGAEGVARVVGVDEGQPPLSSTATLSITVTDVNDCPPRLLPPTVLHVREGASAARLGVLTATDDDVWEMGHGPPFALALAASNPAHVLDLIALKFDANLDSGRGGAEVWALGPVDRERHRQLTAEVVVRDAGGLAASHPVTVVVDDVNDNPMRPAAKTVYLWKIQGGGSDASLGRVYVDDPDDWDLDDKSFAWAGSPHPLFSLNTSTGDIYASPLLREGRYELHFSVSDRVWGQHNVRANVTVGVRYLTHEALAHAVPITLTPTTPSTLTAGWTPQRGGGGLGTLTKAVQRALGGGDSNTVDVVSVYGRPEPSPAAVSSSPPTPPSAEPAPSVRSRRTPARAPYACVWVSVRAADDTFMDPVKVQGVLALHIQQLEQTMNLRISFEDPLSPAMQGGEVSSSCSPSFPSFLPIPHSHLSFPSLLLFPSPLPPILPQVVDTNSTSLVTPRLTRAHDCRLHARDGDAACTERSCLNGGRCVRMEKGNRCVCPGGASGPRCKVAARSFRGSGWAWVPPLPPCLPSTLSLRLLTRRPRALLLYSGPLSATSARPRFPPTPMMALQLVDGRPQLLMEGARGRVRLQVNASVSTGTWHTLHVHLNGQGVSLMVDFCGRGWTNDLTHSDAHCIARAAWAESHATEGWAGQGPLQVGGLAHPRPRPSDYGWSEAPVKEDLEGCVSHLRVNDQLIDLGEPAYSSGSERGCTPQAAVCREKVGDCGFRGRCVGGLDHPECQCDPGWAGPGCTTPTEPISFGRDSYMKVATPVTLDPYAVTAQLRVRARGRPDGVLLKVLAVDRSTALMLQLRAGVACAWASGAASGEAAAALEACVEGFPLGDGAWHTVRLERHGHNLLVAVDDGDGWRRNESLASFLTSAHAGDMRPLLQGTPMPILVDKQNCCVVGGDPELEGEALVAVHGDLRESCLDDVRLAGRPVTLLGGEGGDRRIQGGQEDRGCPAPDLCTNTSCLPPLSCHSSWAHASCSCGPGHHLVGRSCRDVDECAYDPCLHGGTCYNLVPGYRCACGPAFEGENCQWAKLPPHAHTLATPILISAITFSSFLMVILILAVAIRVRRWRSGAGGDAPRPDSMEGLTGGALTPDSAKGECQRPPSASPREEKVRLETLKVKIPGTKLRLVEKPPPVSHTCTTTLAVDDDAALRELSLVAAPASCRASPHSSAGGRPTPSISRSCSASSVRGDASVAKRLSLPRLAGSPMGAADCPRAVAATRVSAAQPLLPQDDLRAYAYEGDGSPSGSLTSTVLGLRTASIEDTSARPLIPEYGEVLDLIRNLPDAADSPLLRLPGPRRGLEGGAGPPSLPTPEVKTIARPEDACDVRGRCLSLSAARRSPPEPGAEPRRRAGSHGPSPHRYSTAC